LFDVGFAWSVKRHTRALQQELLQLLQLDPAGRRRPPPEVVTHHTNPNHGSRIAARGRFVIRYGFR
jgi:hypothetical protein